MFFRKDKVEAGYKSLGIFCKDPCDSFIRTYVYHSLASFDSLANIDDLLD